MSETDQLFAASKGGILPLDAARVILQALTDGPILNEEVVILLRASVVRQKDRRIREIYSGEPDAWRAYTRDILEQLEKQNLARKENDKWKPGEAFRTGVPVIFFNEQSLTIYTSEDLENRHRNDKARNLGIQFQSALAETEYAAMMDQPLSSIMEALTGKTTESATEEEVSEVPEQPIPLEDVWAHKTARPPKPPLQDATCSQCKQFKPGEEYELEWDKGKWWQRSNCRSCHRGKPKENWEEYTDDYIKNRERCADCGSLTCKRISPWEVEKVYQKENPDARKGISGTVRQYLVKLGWQHMPPHAGHSHVGYVPPTDQATESNE